jgi:hypothetical protein
MHSYPSHLEHLNQIFTYCTSCLLCFRLHNPEQRTTNIIDIEVSHKELHNFYCIVAVLSHPLEFSF